MENAHRSAGEPSTHPNRTHCQYVILINITSHPPHPPSPHPHPLHPTPPPPTHPPSQVRATLQDMRVLKTVFKIAKGDEIYSVTVYRDKGMVYFDAYDPQTSRVYLTRLA